MNELVNKIKSLIETVHSRVYIEVLPQGYKYPYVMINFPTSTTDELREDFILEVDVYYNTSKQNASNLENIVANIDNILNRKKILEQTFYCRLERINRLSVNDPDPQIRRRQLRYRVKTQFK